MIICPIVYRICQIVYKIFKTMLKICQILKNYQQTFKFGEILPNVVTLIWGIYTNKAFNEFTQVAN